jgi:hypothetical protein
MKKKTKEKTNGKAEQDRAGETNPEVLDAEVQPLPALRPPARVSPEIRDVPHLFP